MTNDKKVPSSVISAVNRRNAIRSSGSTWSGRLRDSAYGMFLGGSPVDKMDAQIEGYKNVSSLIKSINSQAEADNFWTDDGYTGMTVKALKQRWENMQAAGTYTEGDIARARKDFEDAKSLLIEAVSIQLD